MNEDDFISRKAAINAELRITVDIPLYKTRTIKAAEGAIERAVVAYAEHLQSIPAADVRPVVRGEWIVDSIATNIFHCSVCGNDAPVEPTGGTEYKSNFCPNCGADMRGGGEK